MTKKACLAILVTINLSLAAGLLMHVLPGPRAALAQQGTGLAGNYLVVSGQIQSNLDAFHLLDVRDRALHSFFLDRGSVNLVYAGYRDLERDLRHNAEEQR